MQHNTGKMSLDELLKELSGLRKFVHDTPELSFAEQKQFCRIVDECTNHIAAEKVVNEAWRQALKIIAPIIPAEEG